MPPSDDELVERAAEVRARAYAPYSGYPVGAAVLGEDGQINVGVNVENASYGLTVCAERNALFAMAARGCRRFTRLAVVTRDGGPPCGACRQVMAEFAAPGATILISDGQATRETTVPALLPDAFRLSPSA